MQDLTIRVAIAGTREQVETARCMTCLEKIITKYKNRGNALQMAPSVKKPGCQCENCYSQELYEFARNYKKHIFGEFKPKNNDPIRPDFFKEVEAQFCI